MYGDGSRELVIAVLMCAYMEDICQWKRRMGTSIYVCALFSVQPTPTCALAVGPAEITVLCN